MHSEMKYLIDLMLILAASSGGAWLAKRLNQPQIVGQILGGVLIGSSILGIVEQSEFIGKLSEIGVIVLMFITGLETSLSELKASAERSAAIAIGGIVLPFAMGFLSIMLLKENFMISEAVFLGVILTATSMGVTVKILAEFRALQSKQGVSVLGAAVIDDIVGIMILSVALGAFGKSTASLWMLLMKIAIFFVIVIFAGEWISTAVNRNIRILKELKSKFLLPISISLILLFAITASEFGMAAIIGAYFVGVILSTTQMKHRITHEVEKFGTGFFIPIFFVNIGLSVNMTMVGKYFTLAIAITFVGILSKVIGSGIGARISGFDYLSSLQIGVSMVPRAEVALIVSNIALKAGLIGEDIFVGVILLVIVSSVVSPMLYKGLEQRKKKTSKLLKDAKKKVA
ncbi:cation:proton antiporter [Gottschalkiaceae bacterium SANA]|nr:cation:proton antiporter [Gottschalkiaceae bacterium SANA]